MYRSLCCVVLALTLSTGCGGVAPDDPSPVAGTYSPVEFVFSEDSCGLEESLRTLTDAEYTFGKEDLRDEYRDTGDSQDDLDSVIEAGALDLWNLCSEFPSFYCRVPPTFVHFDPWKDAALGATGCTLEELKADLGGDGDGLFLNEEELILKESIYTRCAFS